MLQNKMVNQVNVETKKIEIKDTLKRQLSKLMEQGVSDKMKRNSLPPPPDLTSTTQPYTNQQSQYQSNSILGKHLASKRSMNSIDDSTY
jgi:hypothetical protein